MAAVVGVIGVVGVGVLVMMAPTGGPICPCGPPPVPPTSPTPCPTPSVVAIDPAVPASTYEEFATLSAGQQQALMQQALDRYDAVVADTFASDDPALIAEVATGRQLSILEGEVQSAARNHLRRQGDPGNRTSRGAIARALPLRRRQAGADVEALMPLLSTYLGHTEPKWTFWYLTATPELLALVGERVEALLGDLP